MPASPPTLAFLGLSDPLVGVFLGWALATATAAASTVATSLRRRSETRNGQRAAARLILEELKVARRAIEDFDARLVAGAGSLPTDVWNQRREQLLGSEEWGVVADAFAEIDELNHRRTAQAIWRTEGTANDLVTAREALKPKLAVATQALERLAGP